MSSWANPLPINVAHYPAITKDDRYLKCVEFLRTTNAEFLTKTFGDPIRIKRTYQLWPINYVAISGVVQPFSLTFNVKLKDNDESVILHEIYIIYNILKQELQWPE